MILGIEGERIAEMVRFFLVALAVVAPMTFVWVRRSQKERRADALARRAADADTDDIGSVIDPDELSLTIAAIDAAAPSVGEPVDVDVSLHPLIDGQPAPDQLVEALIGDAVRRRGMTWEWRAVPSNGTPPTHRMIRVSLASD